MLTTASVWQQEARIIDLENVSDYAEAVKTTGPQMEVMVLRTSLWILQAAAETASLF